MARLTVEQHLRTARAPGRKRTRAAPVILLTRNVQCGLAVGLFVVSAWLTAATISYVGSRNLLIDRADYISELEDAYDKLVADSQTSTQALVGQVESLEDEVARQEEALQQSAEIQASLEAQLASRDRQLAAIERERDHVAAVLARLEDGLGTTATQLVSTHKRKAELSRTVEQLEMRLSEATFQRDAVRRAEQALRWQVARLESRLESIDQNRDVAQLWFKDWVGSSVEALQELFVNTGVDLEILVARAAGNDVGAGGPFEGVEALNVLHQEQAGGDPMTAQIRRLSALQKLASSLPLASPLDHFHVTSHFGKRRDPFTSRLAFHSGLDLGAAPTSEILATAPGEVTYAGDNGPYGNMVEIDHGMGVTTRYGHLNAVKVQAGDMVDFRQPIGVIGNTGRSTARHLHYEVRIDGKAYNPAKFLEAGRYLVDVFNLRPGGGSSGGDGLEPGPAEPAPAVEQIVQEAKSDG